MIQSIPTLPSETSGRRDDVQPGSAFAGTSPDQDERFYTSLYVITAAAIERAFDGEHGDEREEPDEYHRAADTR